MILRGVIEHTFGGALCFRGFAKIGDLANLSFVKDSYQRKVDIERSAKILEFLENGTYRFFPELIFGLQFQDSNAIENILQGKKSTFEDEINFNLHGKDFKEYVASDKYDSPILRRISLEFTKIDKKYLSRIDGNHRLSAVEKLSSDKSKDIEKLNFLIPFCIILQAQSETAEKYENAYFHLINANAKPLTSEENLKAILGKDYFLESEITEILGKGGVDAQKLINELSSYKFLGINHLTDNNLRSICLSSVNLITAQKPKATVDDLQAAIQTIDILYSENEKLKSNNSVDILLAFIYYKLKDKKQFEHFKDWVINNHIFKIPATTASNIIEIFDKIHEKRVYKVFVAMPYWSHPEVSEYNKLFAEAIKEVEKKAKVDLELIPIMRFGGKSQRIDQRLINQIKECDIFIANITGSYANVIFEVGFAEAMERPMILLKEEHDEAIVPFDMDKLQWIPYLKETYYNSIKGIVVRNLIEILKKDFKVSI